MERELPIGFFDSGVGGLTVLKAVGDLLPQENLFYLGDTARVPYGTKSGDTIVRYTLMAAEKLASFGIKMLVIACNTATSAALPHVRKMLYPMPVLGVVEPGAAAAVAASKNGRIAVVATEATIRGGAYQQAIGRLAPDARVVARACTLFVALAEEGWIDGPIAESIAQRYIGDIFDESGDAATDAEIPDTLLLGCTHFPLLIEPLQKIAGSRALIVDSARATAIRVREELARLNIFRDSSDTAQRRFATTDNRERFASSGSLFLGDVLAPADVELIDL